MLDKEFFLAAGCLLDPPSDLLYSEIVDKLEDLDVEDRGWD